MHCIDVEVPDKSNISGDYMPYQMAGDYLAV